MTDLLWLALGLHLLLCTAALALRQLKLVRIHGGMLAVACLVPVFGFLSILAVGIALFFCANTGPGGDHDAEDPAEAGVAISAATEADRGILPLEEALLINDAKTRRAMLLNILLYDPAKQTDLLQAASLNDDPEVAHYATTAIMEV